MPNINAVLRMHFVRALIGNVCGGNIEIIKRPASFLVKSKEEGTRDIQRIIVLPPKGFTADTLNQTNSHDEVERATIQVKGGVRISKNGFSRLKNCLLVASFNKSAGVSELDKPYLTFDLKNKTPGLQTEFHSSGGAPFAVVKANGLGFYHNLINVSDGWLVLKLNKRLRAQREVSLDEHLHGLQTANANVIQTLYAQVLKHGDGIFKKAPDLINQVVNMNTDQSLPPLVEMLHVYDSGKHEACSVFAVILKIGKTYPEKVINFLNEAIEDAAVPEYYAHQLIGKIQNFNNSSDQQIKAPG